MANSTRTPAEERAASVAAEVVLAALVIVPIVGVAWLVAFYFGAQGDEVGPDADEMAKDPVLHIEIDPASPGEIRADTGEEGGIAPGLTNSISTARRDWALNTADWEGALFRRSRGGRPARRHLVVIVVLPVRHRFHRAHGRRRGRRGALRDGGRWAVRARQRRTVPQDRAQQRRNRPSGVGRTKAPGTHDGGRVLHGGQRGVRLTSNVIAMVDQERSGRQRIARGHSTGHGVAAMLDDARPVPCTRSGSRKGARWGATRRRRPTDAYELQRSLHAVLPAPERFCTHGHGRPGVLCKRGVSVLTPNVHSDTYFAAVEISRSGHRGCRSCCVVAPCRRRACPPRRDRSRQRRSVQCRRWS